MKDVFRKFSENLRTERIAKGYTQQKMAELLGISQPVYNRYEKGGTLQGREPDVETLVKICRMLEVSVDYMLGLDNE